MSHEASTLIVMGFWYICIFLDCHGVPQVLDGLTPYLGDRMELEFSNDNSQVLRMERHPLGWVIGGPAPIDAFSEALSMLGFQGFSFIDMGLLNSLRNSAGVSPIAVVVRNEQDGFQWREQVTQELDNDSSLDDYDRWLRGVDTGNSALTLFAHLASNGMNRYRSWTSKELEPSLPRDHDDFGRCKRLVEQFGWEPYLYRVAALLPEWACICWYWDALCGFYDREDHEGLQNLLRTKTHKANVIMIQNGDMPNEARVELPCTAGCLLCVQHSDGWKTYEVEDSSLGPYFGQIDVTVEGGYLLRLDIPDA